MDLQSILICIQVQCATKIWIDTLAIAIVAIVETIQDLRRSQLTESNSKKKVGKRLTPKIMTDSL